MSQTAGTVRALDSHPHGYRERIHRALRLTPHDQFRPSEASIDANLAFWPTRREHKSETLSAPITRCQRCGVEVAPTVGWWCQECRAITEYLQVVRGLSMVGIAHSGEFDPIIYEQVFELAPWLMFRRESLPIRSDCDDVNIIQAGKTNRRRLGRDYLKFASGNVKRPA